MKNELPTPVQWAINRLTSCSFEAYAVGGCVRDMLLAREPHDWDVCTSASPEEVIDCFANVRVLTTGIRHGTVTAMLDGQPVEITTYRVDSTYTDHRHPDAVRFTASLREDLSRRDFTINAMAFRPESGIIDFFGGKEDLKAGIIRCVGDPDTRFTEDALRILRALRFASRFAFAIEPDTSAALLRHKDALRMISAERILSELLSIEWARFDEKYLPVIQVVIPELQRVDVREGLPKDPAIRMAALLRGLDAESILRRLKASTALTKRTALLASMADVPVRTDPAAIKRVLRYMGPEATGQLLLLQDNEAGLHLLTEILAQGDVYSVRQLDVNGKDLVNIGLEGKQVGQALDMLLDKVIEGELPNVRQKLLKAIGISVTLHGIL